MIAEPPQVCRPPLASAVLHDDQPERELSIARVVGTLQLLLAARRAARNADHAHCAPRNGGWFDSA